MQSGCKCHHLFVHRRALTCLFFWFFPPPPVSGSLFLQKVRGFPTSADFLGSNMALEGVKVRMGTPKDRKCKRFININLQNVIWFHNIDEICRLTLWAQQTADEASPEWVNPSLTWPFHLFTFQEQLKAILVWICQMAQTSTVFLQFPIATVVDP